VDGCYAGYFVAIAEVLPGKTKARIVLEP